MNEHQICARCVEKTKRPTGFWDGENGNGQHIGGQMFSCENMNCAIAARRRAASAQNEEKRQRAIAENANNGISAKDFVAARRGARLTMRDAAKLAGVHPADISKYETEREPFPPEVYRLLMGEIELRKKET